MLSASPPSAPVMLTKAVPPQSVAVAAPVDASGSGASPRAWCELWGASVSVCVCWSIFVHNTYPLFTRIAGENDQSWCWCSVQPSKVTVNE